MEFVILRSGVRLTPGRFCDAFMAKLVRHLTSNEEIVSSNLAEGILFCEALVCVFFFRSSIDT